MHAALRARSIWFGSCMALSSLSPVIEALKLVTVEVKSWPLTQSLWLYYIDDLYHMQVFHYRIRENFRWIKTSPSPSTFVFKKIFEENIFANVVKVTISSMQSLTQDKKIHVIKFLPMRAGGEIGENFYVFGICHIPSSNLLFMVMR